MRRGPGTLFYTLLFFIFFNLISWQAHAELCTWNLNGEVTVKNDLFIDYTDSSEELEAIEETIPDLPLIIEFKVRDPFGNWGPWVPIIPSPPGLPNSVTDGDGNISFSTTIPVFSENDHPCSAQRRFRVTAIFANAKIIVRPGGITLPQIFTWTTGIFDGDDKASVDIGHFFDETEDVIADNLNLDPHYEATRSAQLFWVYNLQWDEFNSWGAMPPAGPDAINIMWPEGVTTENLVSGSEPGDLTTWSAPGIGVSISRAFFWGTSGGEWLNVTTLPIVDVSTVSENSKRRKQANDILHEWIHQWFNKTVYGPFNWTVHGKTSGTHDLYESPHLSFYEAVAEFGSQHLLDEMFGIAPYRRRANEHSMSHKNRNFVIFDDATYIKDEVTHDYFSETELVDLIENDQFQFDTYFYRSETAIRDLLELTVKDNWFAFDFGTDYQTAPTNQSLGFAQETNNFVVANCNISSDAFFEVGDIFESLAIWPVPPAWDGDMFTNVITFFGFLSARESIYNNDFDEHVELIIQLPNPAYSGEASAWDNCDSFESMGFGLTGSQDEDDDHKNKYDDVKFEEVKKGMYREEIKELIDASNTHYQELDMKAIRDHYYDMAFEYRRD
jgi:hypothetical protein